MERFFRFEDNVAAGLPGGTASGGKESRQGARPKCHGVFSCDGQYFVPKKVKPDSFRSGRVEEKCRRCLNHVGAQFIPRVALREKIFRQAFRAIAAIGFLDGLEHQIDHRPPCYRSLCAHSAPNLIQRKRHQFCRQIRSADCHHNELPAIRHISHR